MLAALTPATSLPAQESAESSLTIALGRALGIGGDYGKRGAYAIGVTFSHAFGTLEDNRWSKRVGGGGGATFGSRNGGTCPEPTGSCAPRFPLVTYVSPLVGLERAGERGTIGALVGPTLFGAGSGSRGGRGVGLDARLDLMLGMTEHTGITGGLHVLVLPNVAARTLVVSSLVIGLQIF